METPPHAMGSPEVRDLGRVSYAEALTVQRQVHAAVFEGRSTTVADRDSPMQARLPGVVLLLEHDPPVITITRRPGAAAHLLADPRQLASAGIEVAQTDRGGDITYHGPGQLVAYPILDLSALGLRLTGYVRLLEQVVIDTLERFGMRGERDPAPGMTGVWVGQAKIAAIGVRISRWVSMHGVALNVGPNLDHFNLIVPCGLTGRGVTSMARELGDRCPPMDEVKRALAAAFRARLTEPRA
jgi:lipoate-protein ligase B